MHSGKFKKPAALHSSRKPTRLILIEDHAILRDGLRALLHLESEFEVVGEAASAERGVKLAAQVQPELVLTDIALRDSSALTIIPKIKALDFKPRVIVLTAHFSDEYVRAAVEAGADGYILKDATRAELIEGIRAVIGGKQYFSRAVASQVVSVFLGKKQNRNDRLSHALTNREEEVLKLIAHARSNKEIAANLGISVKTIEKHRSNLMRKLNLHNTAAVTLYAIREGIVAIEVANSRTGGEFGHGAKGPPRG